MKKHYRHENDCLNCGTELQGKYCHNCGQENLEIKESFGHMMGHAVSDYFHFDHQFFHTLKPLLFKPGKLTNEYMAGHRAQYLHPIKMYIFISVVFFLLIFQDSHKETKDEPKPKTANEKLLNDSAKMVLDKSKAAIEANKNLSSTQKKILERNLNNGSGDDIDDDEVDVKNGVMTVHSKGKIHGDMLRWTSIDDTTLDQYHARQAKLPEDQRDGFFKRHWNERALLYHHEYGSRSIEVFEEEFKHNIPKMMFVMLPLFALILKLSFLNNKKFYVEHLIYSFHLHCFLFLFLAVCMLLEMILPAVKPATDTIQLLAFFYIVWYIYKSLRTVYHRSAFRTITKMIGMYLTYGAAVLICLTLNLLVTVAGGNILGH